MATSIIPRAEGATPANTPPGVEISRETDGDVYFGKPEALIAAGLLKAEQIPGWPGMPPTSATFVDGVRVERGQRVPRDEHRMQVTRIGSNVRVTKGITAEESRLRVDARQAEIEEQKRNAPKADIGLDGASKSYAEASALLRVGDKVWIGRQPAVVSGEYKLRRVRSATGEFLDKEKGVRIDYQFGYLCQYRNGEEFFWEAGDLLGEDGDPTHLRLVSGRSTKSMRPVMEFRERERQ